MLEQILLLVNSSTSCFLERTSSEWFDTRSEEICPLELQSVTRTLRFCRSAFHALLLLRSFNVF